MSDLRQALAESEQKPLVWMNKYGHVASFQNEEYKDPLYTAPPKREWVGLTDEELSTLSVSAGIISWSKHDYLADKKQFRELPIDEGMDGDKVCLMQFAQLIEAKLKEKNT